jgi:hypothetical protein
MNCHTPAVNPGNMPHSVRIAALLLLALVASGGRSLAQPQPVRAGKLILLPLDDRPAVAQFAEMIGAIGDQQVVMPPVAMLGRFTRPGDAKQIGDWLRRLNYSQVDALVISVDMLCYGGLIASRTPAVAAEAATERLEFFRWFKKAHPKIPVYAFGVLMRVAPTADAASRPWRDDLARWSELTDRVQRAPDPALEGELSALKKKLDPAVIDSYLAARKRDLAVNLAMVELRQNHLVDGLIFLQDDARVYGLHRQDQNVLLEKINTAGLQSEVPVYNGADEGALSLVSRAILAKYRQKINVAVVFSSDKGKKAIAPYEDHPLESTVRSQIAASGAVLVQDRGAADYTLFVNAPETSEAEFIRFRLDLIESLKAGQRVCLADVLFPAPHLSGADERLIVSLENEGVMDQLSGYAAWNTAGNALGTAIPHANMRLLSIRRFGPDAAQVGRTTVAHIEFLLNRFAGDYLYHDIVRLQVNRELREQASIPTDEFTPEVYERVNRDIAKRLKPLIEDFHARLFKDKIHPLEGTQPPRSLKVGALRDISIQLPWPRTFEVALRFSIETEQVPAARD